MEANYTQEVFNEEIRVLKRSYRSVLHKGVSFIDLNPIFASPYKFNYAIYALRSLALEFDLKFTQVLAPEARGFILGPVLASRMNCGFIPIRKEGKLPVNDSLATVSYDTEYSKDNLQLDTSLLRDFEEIIIYDDVLATGGTAIACRDLCEKRFFKPCFVFFIEIEALQGRQRMINAGIPDKFIKSIIKI